MDNLMITVQAQPGTRVARQKRAVQQGREGKDQVGTHGDITGRPLCVNQRHYPFSSSKRLLCKTSGCAIPEAT